MPENETKVLEFEPREWKDDKEGGTPIDALALNRMEQGIADAINGVNDVNLNLMTYLVASEGETATLDINGRPIVAPCYIYDKAEMVTWLDSGVEGEERVKPFPSQADMQAVRDSLDLFELINVDKATFSVENSKTLWAKVETVDGETLLLQAQPGKEASFGFFRWDCEIGNWSPFWTIDGK